MPSVLGIADSASDYAVHFDAPLERFAFAEKLVLSGWVFHRSGEAINGIRAIVRRPFRGKEDVRGRRKRERPDAAAAFPEQPQAATSGFFFELPLRLGTNRISFQLFDHARRWHTFASATVISFPLSLLEQLGLSETRAFFLHALQRRFEARPVVLTNPAQPMPALMPTRIDLFATTRSNLFMIEIGELVAAGFRKLGYAAQLHLDEVPALHPPEGTLQLVVAPHEFHLLFLMEKFPRAEVLERTRRLHLLCTEQPGTTWFESSLYWAKHSAGVADLSPLGIAAYRASGLAPRRLGLGFDPLLAHSHVATHATRRHELVFLGAMTKRREEFIARHSDFFARHACHLHLVPLGFAKTATSRSYLDAARRNRLLSDSRILLNLHHGEQRYFEWHRVLLGLANGCCVITESCVGYGPLVPGKHFVMVEPEHLITACDYYLAHPAECEAIAHAGRQFVESELRQDQQCAAFLSGSVVLEDPTPLAYPPQLQRLLSRETRRHFAEALRRDFRKAEPPPPVRTVCEEAERDRVVEKRSGYRARLAQQEDARAAGGPVWELHENDAFLRTASPALSILVTLYNYAAHIDDCLASATAAAAQLNEPVEIVIVNDASTDDSLVRALRRLRKASLPMRVADKKFNTGLADARNTAVTLARAPFVFMMDADNLVCPDALRQLLELIRREEAAAAYSMITRFAGTPENRIALLSHFDWDPEVLVQHPYIDAMAMFRRDTVLELGGYDTTLSQIGWFGWEDYEMWLRFAERDLPVAFLPNTLCLYRDHETSMLKSTNLFQDELVRHFANRFGDLVRKFEPREAVFGVSRRKVFAEETAAIEA